VLALSVSLTCVVSAAGDWRAAREHNPVNSKPTTHERSDSNDPTPAYDPFERFATPAAPAMLRCAVSASGGVSTVSLRTVNFQDTTAGAPRFINPRAADESVDVPPPRNLRPNIPPADVKQQATSKDLCAAAAEKPFFELGIGIALPAGRLPTDHAATCWELVNATAGPLAGSRCWSDFGYQWDATCFSHRPLYFEEINLERYGYGCNACLQPAASAAHFFGTVPALPYLVAIDCPHECVYTLGHYRPGSCPPWRHHWPPCDGLAAAAEAGVLTGMIFLIP
jgi:hypothetical protein